MSLDFDAFKDITQQGGGPKMTKAQQRQIKIQAIMKKFKGQDQLIFSTPNGDWDPGRVVAVTPERAAEILVDNKGRIPTKEEVSSYHDELAKAKEHYTKEVKRRSLTEALKESMA